MKINSQLKQIRKDYQAIEPPSEFKKYGWLALRSKIEAYERRRFTFLPIFTHNIVFATITIVLLGGGFIGLVKASQSSLPGDTLYPVKRLSETVTTAILRGQQIRLEKRAEEVVGVAKEKDDPALLEETVKKYQEAVSKTKQEVEKSGKKDEFQKKLKRQEQQFKDVSEQIPASKDILKEAIEATKQEINSEVKGIKHQEETSLEIKQEVEKSKKIEEGKEEIEAVQKEIKEIIK